MNFSENLKKLMEIKGITRTDLADLLETHYNTIEMWTRGRCYPSIKSLMKLCEIFNVTPNQLLGYEESPKITEQRLEEMQKTVDRIMNDLYEICDAIVYTKRKVNEL